MHFTLISMKLCEEVLLSDIYILLRHYIISNIKTPLRPQQRNYHSIKISLSAFSSRESSIYIYFDEGLILWSVGQQRLFC